jgi:hypothetical protein
MNRLPKLPNSIDMNNDSEMISYDWKEKFNPPFG